MPCPTCQTPLQIQMLDNQKVLHCSHCGSTFFDENGINRISAESAHILALNKKVELEPPSKPACPRDEVVMMPLAMESIPAHIHLFQCSKCLGVFAGPRDLADFKRAQEAKVNYFKLWQLPLPSLQSVLVLGLIITLSFTALVSVYNLRSTSLTTTNASDVIGAVTVSRTGPYLFIAFKTTVPVKSQIVFLDTTNRTEISKNVSSGYAQLHKLVTGDLDLEKQYLYKIILVDMNGRSTETPMRTLILEQEK